MLPITNDQSNVFNFCGDAGIGPGRHTFRDFISSRMLGDIIQTVSYIGTITMYPRLAPEGHISCFFGNLVFRKSSTIRSLFIDNNFPNYGINVTSNTEDTQFFNPRFDSTSYLFKIPIKEDLIFEQYDPFVAVGCINSSSILNAYRPQIHSFDYTNGKILNIYFYDIINDTTMNLTTYESLPNNAFRLQIFGYRVVPKADL